MNEKIVLAAINAIKDLARSAPAGKTPPKPKRKKRKPTSYVEGADPGPSKVNQREWHNPRPRGIRMGKNQEK